MSGRVWDFPSIWVPTPLKTYRYLPDREVVHLRRNCVQNIVIVPCLFSAATGIICKDAHCRGTCRDGRCLGYNARRAHSDLIELYLEPVLASPPDYIRARVKFTRQKLRDMSLKDIVGEA